MSYAPIERICKRCGKKFMGGRKSRFCSNECKWIPKQCSMPGCINMTSSAGNYCSILCRNRHIAIKNKETGRMKMAQNRPEVIEKKSISQTIAFENIETQNKHKEGIAQSFEDGRVVWNKKSNIVIKKKCPYCNNKFETATDRKYCSRSCLNKATHTDNKPIDEQLIIKLKNEGKTDFEVVEIMKNANSEVKIKNTINKLVKEGKIIKKKVAWNKGKISNSTEIINKECKYCHNIFQIKRNKLKENDREKEFCCLKCFYEFTKLQKPAINKICLVCGQSFDTRNYNKIYCSNECKHKGINANLQNANKEKYTSEKRTETQLKRWENMPFEKRNELKQKVSNIMNTLTEEQITEKNRKTHQTKKDNGSYIESKAENKIYDIILTKYPDIQRHYDFDTRYANINGCEYECDFYIPSLDLFIEYQGMWTHGDKPFDGKNIPINWLKKAGNSNFYKGALKVYTESDPAKRKCAKDNNLNYLEIWNYKDENDLLAQIDNYVKSRNINIIDPIMLSIVGTHGNESIESILNRKINDITINGFCLWKYWSFNFTKEITQKIKNINEIKCYFVLPVNNTTSDIKNFNIAKEYSLNENDWLSIPESMSPIIGINKNNKINPCLYIKNIELKDFTINLADYRNINNNGKIMEKFDLYGSTVLCFNNINHNKPLIERKVIAIATISNPFIALVR